MAPSPRSRALVFSASSMIPEGLRKGWLEPLHGTDQRLVADVRTELEEAWCSGEPESAVSRALARLTPCMGAGLIAWRGSSGREMPVVTGTSDPTAWHPFGDGYAVDGRWRRDLVYDPRRVDPLAGCAVDTAFIRPLNTDRFESFRENFLEPYDLAGILRVTVYGRSSLLAVCGHVRSRDQGDFSARDRSVFQEVVPLLTDGLASLTGLRAARLTAEHLSAVIEAVTLPAFVVSASGRRLLENAAARLAFPKPPDWLSLASAAEGALPSFVRRVTLRSGGTKHYLLLVDTFDEAPEHAHLTPWARRWNLPPRYARVALGLIRGLSYKEIAAATGLTPDTVRTYAKRLLARAGVHSRAEFVTEAYRVASPRRTKA